MTMTKQEKPFWCAERIDANGLCAEWWTGVSGYALHGNEFDPEVWTKDIHKATRFESEAEANEVIAHEQLDAKATDHLIMTNKPEHTPLPEQGKRFKMHFSKNGMKAHLDDLGNSWVKFGRFWLGTLGIDGKYSPDTKARETVDYILEACNNHHRLLAENKALRDQKFNMPKFEHLLQVAILFNGGKLETDKLTDMVAMCQFVLDRLHENNDVTKASSKEAEDAAPNEEVEQ
jgi:hypothetical protein